MNRARAVLLDFGGVLYRPPNLRWLFRLLNRMGMENPGPMNLMWESPSESPVVWDIMTGKTPEQSLWEEMAQRWRVRPGLIQFMRRYGYTTQRLNRELLVFLHSLRPTCKTAILTNAASDFRGSFGKAFGLETHVDQLIISAEEGVCKPDPRIYQLAVDRLGVRPEAAIFVDDLVENVSGAQKAGLQAFVHENTASTVRRIQEFLK